MVESNLLINKLFAEHHSSISKNNAFVEYQNKDFLPHRKIYAFYLPQFHEMSINNIQWGTGFTEWTNVIKGIPRFEGHRLPRIPRDFGFYDLTSNEIIERQIKSAKNYGISGFITYLYFFDQNIKPMIEVVDRLYMIAEKLDFEIGLMWVNENWTRIWDGSENEIIIKQNYPHNYCHNLFNLTAKYLQSPCYPSFFNKKSMLIYRPWLLPNSHKFVRNFKELCEQSNFEIDLGMPFQPNLVTAHKYGFDFSFEFSPFINSFKRYEKPKIKVFDEKFYGRIFKYEKIIEDSLQQMSPHVIKTVSPGWDNSPRKPLNSLTIYGDKPLLFKYWIEIIIKNNPLPIFDNAWNECAECAYLEPDTHFGWGYLNAISEALTFKK